MHVDGFRFDLAATLARQEGGFSPMSAFFDLVAQDPVVSQAKLIAEPWDVGQMDSYDLGQFPVLWHEWNGRYRDSMRDFWRSQKTGGIAEFATRFAGSSDLYGKGGRTPSASVNLITVHDGFKLRDLVSYDTKHNEANGEANRDGTSDNRSWNCGAEGPTPDPEVLALRARQSRAMLATLLLSFGVRLGHRRQGPGRLGDGARRNRHPVITGHPDPGGQPVVGHGPGPGLVQLGRGDDHHDHGRHQQQEPRCAGEQRRPGACPVHDRVHLRTRFPVGFPVRCSHYGSGAFIPMALAPGYRRGVSPHPDTPGPVPPSLAIRSELRRD
jgi:hypothetical protein